MIPRTAPISRQGKKIRIEGALDLYALRGLLAAIHQATAVKGYQDVTLDFSDATRAYPGPMLAALATSARLREESDVDFSLVRPRDRRLRRLFANANWAHLVNPLRFAASAWQPADVMPARSFTSPDQQHEIVDQIMDAVLSSPAALTRESLAAFEWAVNEITDNVLQHAEATLGGLVQLSHYRQNQRLEFAVADAGRGIPDTMRTTRTGISDPAALELSIKRGITRHKDAGQGNGLFGTHRAARVGEGDFEVHSGYASLRADLTGRPEKVPLHGTLVVVTLDYSDPGALWRALDMHDSRGDRSDYYVERRYEHPIDEILNFAVREEVGSVGSRSAGRSARTKLENLMRMYPRYPVDLDFADSTVISSSFADEFVGKLFVRMGALRFTREIRFSGVTPTVQSVLDKAILQRVQQEAEDDLVEG